MDTYKTILDDVTTQFTEKHSRFIGYVSHTETDEEAVAFIEKIRSLNSDARHNVYAYVLNEDNRMRYSDDGEPHGTAGKPILDIICGMELRVPPQFEAASPFSGAKNRPLFRSRFILPRFPHRSGSGRRAGSS